MHADQTHEDPELSYPDRGAHRLIVRSRCWPLPSDSEETQLALPTDDAGAGGESAVASARARRRRPGRPAEVVIPPFPLRPAEEGAAVPMPAFDELHAAALACAQRGGTGQRNAYECDVVAERIAA